MQGTTDSLEREAILLSLSLGVSISLIWWCFDPLLRARTEAILLTTMATAWSFRAVQRYFDVVRLRQIRKRDREYW